VAVVVTAVLRAMKVADGVDGTADSDYTAEREDPTFRDLPDPLSDEPLGGSPPGSEGGATATRR
jgi:solute:Na+ symporter, SSS family